MIEIPMMGHEFPKVMIGGVPFEVRMNETDILETQVRLFNQFNQLKRSRANRDNAPHGAQLLYVEQVVQLKRDMAAFVDNVLGEGAFAAISGGGFVDDQTLAEITVKVREAAIEAIAEAVERRYE